MYEVYKDKLHNCSCNQLHFIGTYKYVEKNSMTKNGGRNNDSEKWIKKNTAATDMLIEAVQGCLDTTFQGYVYAEWLWQSDWHM